ncbi:unnamed protein product [Gongylonema pulchrum]|uniref:RYYR-CCHC domain-containing protein n=1 Tax=Gongylonema pulchrum TaxID=637853 RepID=A0A3P6R0C9_9BILA|nr:unnamed protein product [Gongylonema pulchrum]
MIIFEPGGQAARIYRINGRSDRLGIVYYRCSKCDVICRRRKKMGAEESELVRGTVKVEQGNVIDNMYPSHHRECALLTLEIVKGLAEELEHFLFAREYENIVYDSATTVIFCLPIQIDFRFVSCPFSVLLGF